MTRCGRGVAVLLVTQQLLYTSPALGAVNVDASHPLDVAALLPADAFEGPSPPRPERFRGEASFEIPILAARGVGEATPRVRLSYNSSQGKGNGPMGVGWALDLGFPTIVERSTRDGAPEYGASDTYQLGGERLIETLAPGRYVTERFDHSRIEFISAGGYWQVLRPDGTRLYYGYQPDLQNESVLASEQILSSAPIGSDCPSPPAACTALHEVVPPGVPFAWYLDRIEDRDGNVLHLGWQSLGDPGSRYLARIDYGEHVPSTPDSVPSFGGATSPTGTLTRSVVFSYEARPDVLPEFRAGFRREVHRRLTTVTSQAGGNPVRIYRLYYEQSSASGRSLLNRVEERGTDDDAGTAFVHTFSYTGAGTAGWSALDPTWALPAGMNYLQYPCGTIFCALLDRGLRITDVNADGYPDLLDGGGSPLSADPMGERLREDGGREPGWASRRDPVGG